MTTEQEQDTQLSLRTEDAKEEPKTDAEASDLPDEPSLPPQSLVQLARLHAQDPSLISGKFTSFHGWVRRIRVGGGGSIVFVDLYDGTKVGSLNCLCEEASYADAGDTATDASDDEDENAVHYTALAFEHLSQSEHISPGCSVVVCGRIVLSPTSATQDFELQASRLRVIG